MRTSSPYAPPAPRGAIELELSSNEGRAPSAATLAGEPLAADAVARYPDLGALRGALARRFDLVPERVLVTAGADDALLRACLATLGEGREALVASPTFEMIPRHVALARGTLREVPWPEGPFPTDAFLEASSARTALAFVVSPNNPTGAVASATDVARIARALPSTLVVLDAAYGELADEDPTSEALEHDNVVVVRSLSKAWGLAGLRLGCALGRPEWVARLAASGNPYPVSAASAHIALRRMESGAADVRDFRARVRFERDELARLLARLGARPAAPAQGNFVLARDLDPEWTTAAAASLGVALRRFPDRADLADAVRVSVPGEPRAFARLAATLEAALAPRALLFDLDGVLADVSRSYRAAIVATAASFGVALASAEIEAAKARGRANDDWALTAELVAARGIAVDLPELVARFEALYQGRPGRPGLRERETLLVPRARLAAWRARCRLAVVTGRPRADARRFLERHGVLDLFDALVCREDAPHKPDPAPVRLALERLGARAAWMLGDTPDDLAAARAAGVVPLGVLAPGSDPERARAALEGAGAARVLARATELEELLP